MDIIFGVFILGLTVSFILPSANISLKQIYRVKEYTKMVYLSESILGDLKSQGLTEENLEALEDCGHLDYIFTDQEEEEKYSCSFELLEECENYYRIQINLSEKKGVLARNVELQGAVLK